MNGLDCLVKREFNCQSSEKNMKKIKKIKRVDNKRYLFLLFDSVFNPPSSPKSDEKVSWCIDGWKK